MTQNKKYGLLEMPIGKALFILAIPIIISNLLQVAYQFTDSFWVGRLGADEVAVTTVAGTILFLTISLGSGFSIAGSILIAQYFGAKNEKMVSHIAAQTLLMIIFTSILFGSIGYFFTPQILTLFGVEPHIFDMTSQYVRIGFISLIFSFSFFMIQSIFRGIGQTNLPIYIMLGTVLLNFGLDPLLINGYGEFEGYGVIGAAIATLICQGLASVVGFGFLFSGKYGIHVRLSDYIPDFPTIKKTFFLGLPSSLEMVARTSSYAILMIIVGMFGTLALASFGVAGNIIQFVIIFSMALSMATSILVGQNIGAGQIERAKEINKISMITSFILLTLLGGIIFIFADFIIAFFVPNNQAVIEQGAHIIRITSFFFGLIGIQMSISGVLRAIGKTKIPMYITILGQWIIKLPLAYVLAHFTGLGLDGIWWSEPITSIIICIVMFFIMDKINWNKSNLTHDIKKTKQEKAVTQETLIDDPVKEF